MFVDTYEWSIGMSRLMIFVEYVPYTDMATTRNLEVLTRG